MEPWLPPSRVFFRPVRKWNYFSHWLPVPQKDKRLSMFYLSYEFGSSFAEISEINGLHYEYSNLCLARHLVTFLLQSTR